MSWHQRNRYAGYTKPKEIPSGLVMVTGPLYEPLTIGELKSHLRIDGDWDNTYLDNLRATARAAVEKITGRAMYAQTWRYTLDYFPRGCFPTSLIQLPIAPLRSVTTLKYFDTSNVEQTWSNTNYRVVITDVGTVSPVLNTDWPMTAPVPSAVTIDYVTGYTAAAAEGDTAKAIPPSLKHAMLLLAGNWYENRESVTIDQRQPFTLPHGVEALLAPFKAFRV